MKAKKSGWLLYDAGDYEDNRMFAAHMQDKAQPLGLELQVVFTHTLAFPLHTQPDFVISRQRNPKISQALEREGIPVFNSAKVCKICNDKRATHAFLQGLPQMETHFVDSDATYQPTDDTYPLVIKPALGHGGDRVVLAENEAELRGALAAILPKPALVQETASGAGRDLRVYVLFGNIVAAVMRTAKEGIVSNYKRGGTIELHTVTEAETALVSKILQRFAEHGAPLSFAGVDMLYQDGKPVVSEVEDVVGSRMLYQLSDIDIIDLYIQEIAKRL